MSIMQLCKDWTSLHEIRKSVNAPKLNRHDTLLRAVKALVKAGELEERGGVVGISHGGMPTGQYQVRRVEK